MTRDPFIPRTDDGKGPWLANFAAKLGTYAATIGVDPAEVASTIADNNFWQFVFGARNQWLAFAQDWTAYKNAARDGLPLGAMPTPPGFPPAPPLVPTGIFPRAAALAGRIKKHPGYTDAIGQDLMIIGAEQTLDPQTLKPVLKLDLQAGKPNVGWKKQGMDGVEIWVDRGNGFVFLAVDTVPDYLDTAPLPAAGASAIWKYKAIYRLGDEEVGQWSDIASISVMGA